MIYEIRDYQATPETVDALHDRFRANTLPFFERHGIEVLGFWIDAQDPSRILYLTRFEDEDTRKSAWDRFKDDPEWQRVKADSERDGPLTVSQTTTVLEPTDYSLLT